MVSLLDRPACGWRKVALRETPELRLGSSITASMWHSRSPENVRSCGRLIGLAAAVNLGPMGVDSDRYRCLVTGGAGFIGSHLAEALLARGHSVTVIDDLSTGRFENIAHLQGKPGFRFAIDSVLNEAVLDRLASECDRIVHLAAAVGVKLIVENPVGTIETNVAGTEAVFRAALRYRSKVLIASTSEVYGKGSKIPFEEDDDVVLGPTCRARWAYAASKIVDEFLALAYHRQEQLPVVVFRLFNTVGPRQTGQYGMVVPRFVQQALRDKALTVYGDGTQTRCFLHVYDAIKAIISLLTSSRAEGGVFNIGSNQEVTILELAHRILRMVGEEGETSELADRVRFVPYERVYSPDFEDMQRRVPHVGKLKACTGWTPVRSLDQTLADVLAYERTQSRVATLPAPGRWNEESRGWARRLQGAALEPARKVRLASRLPSVLSDAPESLVYSVLLLGVYGVS